MEEVEKEGFATVEQAIEDIKHGKMIVVVDDEDRENEGDLIVAAETVTSSGSATKAACSSAVMG